MASTKKEITLEIIVKSYMTGGHCYLGYDRKNNRIIRPVQLTKTTYIDGNTVHEPRPVDADLLVGWSYSFTYRQDQQQYLTQLPHKNEDLAIDNVKTDISTIRKILTEFFKRMNWLKYDEGFENVVNGSIEIPIKECLLDLAVHSMITYRYVFENTDCSSVNIFRSLSSRLDIYESDQGKNRIKITETARGTIDLPYTAIDTPALRDDESVIIVMSMCRPYAGTEEIGFNPGRCYVLVVGLIQ